MTIIILCTLPNNVSIALNLTKTLLHKKLAACISVQYKTHSFYFWENKLKNNTEIQLLIKTKNSLKQQVFNQIKALHPYKVPEILVLPIIDGDINYLSWITSSLNKE